MIAPIAYTFAPVGAATVGAFVSAWRRPGPTLTSTVQHFAAGVVFAAAAAEILPDVLHGQSAFATLVGGLLGVAVMLLVKQLEGLGRGPLSLLAIIGIDLLVDGLVLGLAFVAGAKAGWLLTVALTLEVLFLGLSVANALGPTVKAPWRVACTTLMIALLLPLGLMLSGPLGALPPKVVTGALSFGLMALLYLVTEELLVEAHEAPDTTVSTSAFFVGFLALLLLEEMIS